MTPPCLCGQEVGTDGRCGHCDYPPRPRFGSSAITAFCPAGCRYCARKAEHCEVCKTDCGTKTAAHKHANECRRAERALKAEVGA